jgi:CheY-like chemotaxis protein
LTDMHMPKMDGFTLIEHIRERPELATATIMSSRRRAAGETPRRCLDLGWQPICLNRYGIRNCERPSRAC